MSNPLREIMARVKNALVQDTHEISRAVSTPPREVGRGLLDGIQHVGDAERQGLHGLQRRFDDRGGQLPWIRGSPRYTPDRAERRLQNMRLTPDPQRTDMLPDTVNRTQVMRAHDLLPWRNEKTWVIFKPSAGEIFGLRNWLPHVPGTLARREVAAYRMDRLFGFGLVPPTALVTRGGREGSIQQFVEFGGVKWAMGFDDLQRQRAAVLHHVIGAADGQRGNYRPDRNGNLVLFDHGLSFPEKPDPNMETDFLPRSDFVTFDPKERLDDDVLRAVDSIDEQDIRDALTDLDIAPSAIEGVLERLNQIRELRAIPGT
ncbi:hypothetical protein [Nocardia sp. NPDC019395]|uniref:hypothetical protein n=1 Tax=Nocardia sp. NPDC019395 TaxID=3154686 RepID=UPI0033CE6045